MGRAAEMMGTTPAFLRAIGEARLITPLRSAGGHRRYSRYQLRIAARARDLEEALRINAEFRRTAAGPDPGAEGR
jgi:DNA-binding transcriptional MerR regulator